MAVKIDILTREELQRYSRHLLLPEIGAQGQQRIKAARVLLIGAGGLGSPLALYLAAAGVGTLGIIDSDAVDVTNLQRQVLHSSDAIGQAKIISAERRLQDLNPHVNVETYGDRLTSANAESIAASYDIIADGSDNFPTRYLVNDTCVALGKPLIYGSVYRFEGQASVFDARCGPCYRCLFPRSPDAGSVPSCNEAGVLGVLPGIIGLIQATETLKLITEIGEPLIGRLLVFDALEMRFRELRIVKDRQCPACGATAGSVDLSEDYHDLCSLPAGGTARPLDTEQFEIEATRLKRKLDAGEPLTLLDVREPVERDISKLNNTHEIPLGELEDRMRELPTDVPMVVYCHSGRRSARAAQQLREAGFTDVRNLSGGILAWIDRVDSSLTKY